ncbi:hypothetical protein JTB14_002013 [Gonioctena quinquepunctata]|nr:hypothetical protein JTB14_002013 [Gonioctena quinquepunctata]
MLKIQQQIMDIIENNQRITNKELIKSKLQDTIMKELVNLIDSTIVDDDREKKQLDNSEVIDVLGDEIKSELEKETGEDLKAPFMDIKMKMKNREPVKIVLFEDIPAIEESLESLGSSDEDYTTGEQDDFPQSTSEISTEEKIDKHELKEEKLAFVKRFKKANEKLDNIMSIIDEIVDTIEITDEESEEEMAR